MGYGSSFIEQALAGLLSRQGNIEDILAFWACLHGLLDMAIIGRRVWRRGYAQQPPHKMRGELGEIPSERRPERRLSALGKPWTLSRAKSKPKLCRRERISCVNLTSCRRNAHIRSLIGSHMSYHGTVTLWRHGAYGFLSISDSNADTQPWRSSLNAIITSPKPPNQGNLSTVLCCTICGSRWVQVIIICH